MTAPDYTKPVSAEQEELLDTLGLFLCDKRDFDDPLALPKARRLLSEYVARETAALRAEVERLRTKNHALNERATKAEAIIARSGILESRPQTGKGRSFGRALANYAAATYRRERDEARAAIERVRQISGIRGAECCISAKASAQDFSDGARWAAGLFERQIAAALAGEAKEET